MTDAVEHSNDYPVIRNSTWIARSLHPEKVWLFSFRNYAIVSKTRPIWGQWQAKPCETAFICVSPIVYKLFINLAVAALPNFYLRSGSLQTA
jgi:hypothetical protein